MDFVIEVNSTAGAEEIYIVRNCLSKEHAKSKLAEYFLRKMNISLLLTIPKSFGDPYQGYYIFGTTQLKDEVTEVYSHYPSE